MGNLNSSERKKEDLDQKSWTLAQSMLYIWLEETQGTIPTPKLTEKFALKLLQAFKSSFQNSIENWKSYCRSVASSDFLMGKIGSFKAWLVWVIREDTFKKIQQGDLGVKKHFVPSKVDIKSSKEDLKRKIETLDISKQVKELRFSLLEKLGAGEYDSWFSRLEIETDDSEITFKGGGEFIMDKIQSRYSSILKATCLQKFKTICIQRS